MPMYYGYTDGIDELDEDVLTPRVTRREFERYTSKYLKDLPIIVTNRGVDDFIVKEV